MMITTTASCQARPLKSYIARIFFIVLSFILVFLGLTFYSYRTFVHFIEVDQAQELGIARSYERLMGSWQKISNRRMEAYLLASPLSVEEENAFRRELKGISDSLETSLRGHKRFAGWLEVKSLLERYAGKLALFQKSMEAVSPKSGIGNTSTLKFYRQLASEGRMFQNTFDLFQAEVASFGRLPPGLSTVLNDETFPEQWPRILAALDQVDQTMASFTGALAESGESPGRVLVFQLTQAVTRLEVRMNFINSLLHELEETATSSVELSVHQDLKKHFLPMKRQLKRMVRQLAVEHVRTEELDDYHLRLREIRHQGISLCLHESDLIWEEIHQDSQRLLAQVHEKFLIRLAILLVALLIGLSSLSFLPARISRPLERLRERFATLVPGEPIASAEMTEIQEINELDRSFRGMVERVNEGVNLHLRYFATIERVWEMVGSLEKNQTGSQRYLIEMGRSGTEAILQFLGNQMKCVAVAGLIEVGSHKMVSWGNPYVSDSIASQDAGESLRQLLAPAALPGSAVEFLRAVVACPGVCIDLETDPSLGIPVSQKLTSLSEVAGTTVGVIANPGNCLGIRLRPRADSVLEAETLLLFLYFHENTPVLNETDRLFVGIIAQQILSFFETLQFLALSRIERHLSQQLAIAKEIQESAIPRAVPPHPALEIDAVITMANAVGGDFYDFFPLADGRYALAIADVSGKNIPAALVTIGLKTGLRALSLQELEPVEVLRRLNQVLRPSISEDHFVTMLYCLIDPGQRTVKIANAGHTPCIRVTSAGAGVSVEKIEIPSYPLGFSEEDFSQASFSLQPGDAVYFYTDGVPDFRNEAREIFGESRLIDLITHLPRHNPAAHVVTVLETFRGQAAIADDYAFIAVRLKTVTV